MLGIEIHSHSQFLHDVVEGFTEKYDCYDMVLYEYRRRILSAGNDNTNALNRNSATAAKSLFAASVQGETITIVKYNMISNHWEAFREINVRRIMRSFQLVWDGNFIFVIGGFRTCTFVRAVSIYTLLCTEKNYRIVFHYN